MISILRLSCQNASSTPSTMLFQNFEQARPFWLGLNSTEQPHAFLTFHNVDVAVWSAFGVVMVRGVTVL